jgi:hypothetical protein
MEGDARSPGVQASNRLKNRYTAPQQIDPAITLVAMLAPGRDTGRWKVKQGAEIVGYVSDVKVGGIESTNCHARAAEQRDTHIELVSRPNGRFPYPARRRGGYPALAGNHGCSTGGLVNAGAARQAARTLDQG